MESADEVRSRSIVDNNKRSFIYRINANQFNQDDGALKMILDEALDRNANKEISPEALSA